MWPGLEAEQEATWICLTNSSKSTLRSTSLYVGLYGWIGVSIAKKKTAPNFAAMY